MVFIASAVEAKQTSFYLYNTACESRKFSIYWRSVSYGLCQQIERKKFESILWQLQE